MFSHALNWAYRAGRTIKWTSITLFLLIGCIFGLIGVWMLVGDMSSPFAWMTTMSGFMCFYMLLVLASEYLTDYSDDYADEPLVKLGQGDHEWIVPPPPTGEGSDDHPDVW